MKITPLEKDMLEKIALDEYSPVNGAVPKTIDETGTWANVIIEDNRDKGVISSLIKKGLINHSGKGEDAVINFTEEGFAVYKSFEVSK